MKLGIFSGTFDPVHDGHIWAATAAQKKLNLDKVVFLPEKEPRTKKPKASYEHRKNMLELAIRDNKMLDIDTVPTRSHSVRSTLEFIDSKYHDPEVITMIIGAEIFYSINSWKDFNILKSRVEFMVYLRGNDERKTLLQKINELDVKAIVLDSKYPALSSSNVRRRLSNSEGMQGLNDKVYQYITTQNLYGI